MKIRRSVLITKRKLIDKKLKSWLPLQLEKAPPSGWLKAIRSSLGITTRQLAAMLNVSQPAVVTLENAEIEGNITLASLERVASAMHCKLIYAIVPNQPFNSLDSILTSQAKKAALKITSSVDHTMKLEMQDISNESSNEQLDDLARHFKDSLDPSLWGSPVKKSK